jgi:lipid-binding SYLF domain-containing protein
MKNLFLNLFALTLVLSAGAADKPQLDNRIRKLTAKFEAMQDNPDKRIPAETLRRAQGIVLLDRMKAGFIFAYQGGGGLAIVKDAKSGQWGPAAFLTATEASLGFQVGGQIAFLVILLMTTNATQFLTDGDIDFGGEARGTAGKSSAGAEGNVKSTPSVLVYGDRHGLYGGAAIKGGTISPNNDVNTAYYGQYAPLKAILFDKKFKPSEVTTELVSKINKAAK